MPRARNIVKILMLTVAMLLLAGNRYAHAQNSPTNPFIDSWHKYRAASVNLLNTVNWTIQSDLTATPAVSYNLTALDNGGATWITVGNENIASVEYAYIEMKFIDADFDPGQTWYLVYSETGATGSCVARRSFQINTVDNTFYLSLPADNFNCNSFSGHIWDNLAGNINLPLKNDSVQFTVTMHKDALFLTDGWRFTATVSILSGGYNLSAPPFIIVSGKTFPGNGNWVLTPGVGGNFSMEVTGPVNFAGTTDDVAFWVHVLGDITTDYQIQLQITGTGGEAESGSAAYTVLTGDNNSGNKIEVKTIYGVPNTSWVMVTP